MELTEDEILQILRLLEESNFDQLHLEIGDLKLIVSKSGAAGRVQDETIPPAASGLKEDKTTATPTEQIAKGQMREEGASETLSTDILEGLVAIRAPILGTFYSRPEPGAPPYVQVGTLVRPDDTVGLLEIMKLFNPVKANVQGHISQICVESGQLVEYNQTLFLVKADQASGER